MPRDNRLLTLLLTIAVCLHIARLHIRMIWLTNIMQKPAAARRALAVELIRRLDQIRYRRDRSLSLPAPRPRFADGLQSRRRSSKGLRLQLHKTNEIQLYLARQSTAVKEGSALEQLVMDSLSKSSPVDVLVSSPEVARDEQSAFTRHGARLSPPLSPRDTAYPALTYTPKSAPELRLHQRVESFSHTKCSADTTAGADDEESLDQTLVDHTDVFLGFATPQYHRQQQKLSANSSSTPIRSPSKVTLQAQSNINGGLLELRASATKPQGPKPPREHRRSMPIALPIRSHPTDTPHLPPPSISSHAPTQQDLELQYKYRHIFIGTASLYDFLSTLPTTPRTTTKTAIKKAFTLLAAREQSLYRQTSLDPANWDLVSRITQDADYDCVTCARVVLGSVSLQRFLDFVPLVEGEVSVGDVVQAWLSASRVDNEAMGVESLRKFKPGEWRGRW